MMHQQLTKPIKKCYTLGKNIVLLIDTNEDLSCLVQLQTKLCYECHIVDPISKIYNRKDNTLPPTSLIG